MICIVCAESREDEPVQICARCHLPHHQNCWSLTGRCSGFLAKGEISSKEETASTLVKALAMVPEASPPSAEEPLWTEPPKSGRDLGPSRLRIDLVSGSEACVESLALAAGCFIGLGMGATGLLPLLGLDSSEGPVSDPVFQAAFACAALGFGLYCLYSLLFDPKRRDRMGWGGDLFDKTRRHRPVPSFHPRPIRFLNAFLGLVVVANLVAIPLLPESTPVRLSPLIWFFFGGMGVLFRRPLDVSYFADRQPGRLEYRRSFGFLFWRQEVCTASQLAAVVSWPTLEGRSWSGEPLWSYPVFLIRLDGPPIRISDHFVARERSGQVARTVGEFFQLPAVEAATGMVLTSERNSQGVELKAEPAQAIPPGRLQAQPPRMIAGRPLRR